jgi:hypothetical protein
VRHFWDVGEAFGQRRGHFIALEPSRSVHADAHEVYAGLAVGYLAIGKRADAVLTAALSVLAGPAAPSCCCDPVGVLFDDRLLRTEFLPELAETLISRV